MRQNKLTTRSVPRLNRLVLVMENRDRRKNKLSVRASAYHQVKPNRRFRCVNLLGAEGLRLIILLSFALSRRCSLIVKGPFDRIAGLLEFH
jgi:hypothetical protein